MCFLRARCCGRVFPRYFCFLPDQDLVNFMTRSSKPFGEWRSRLYHLDPCRWNFMPVQLWDTWWNHATEWPPEVRVFGRVVEVVQVFWMSFD